MVIKAIDRILSRLAYRPGDWRDSLMEVQR